MKRLLIAVTVLALTGCSSIPNSGPVVKGDRVDVLSNDVNVRVIARPPVDGMTPEQIVRGFLAACASVADGDETAREYLTADAAANWLPFDRTNVYDATGLVVSVQRGDKVRVQAPALGIIDSKSRYRVADPGSVIDDTLQLAEVNGQWRIDQVPPALYLSDNDVARSYRAHALFFLDSTGMRLVPEFVVVPSGAGNVSTVVVRALLAGPSKEDPLSTAIPSGTRLTYGSVLGDFGTATVALNSRALRANGVDRDRMLAQIVWTLSGLLGISSVRVQSGGGSLAAGSGATSLSTYDFAEYDPTRRSDVHSLLYISNGDIKAMSAGVKSTIGRGDAVAEAAQSPSGSLLVTVTPDHRVLTARSAGVTAVAATGGDLSSPTVLPGNDVWFVDREAKGGLFQWNAQSGAVAITTGLRARARILDFAVAPDGQRVALIVNDGATTTLRLGFIDRSAAAPRITGLVRVEQRLTSATAVGWLSESELVVLGAVGAVALQPIQVTLPLGSVSLLGGPANPVSLAVAPGESIIVGDQSGQLWEYTTGRWSASELGTAPNYVH